MLYNSNILIGVNDREHYLRLSRANRHGLIAGATGTGKTVTLKVLAESFSKAGVPVFTADIKGDLTGTMETGIKTDDMAERIKRFDLESKGFNFESFPVTFWDVFGKMGHPVRATISEMGPILLSNLLELSEAQEGILNIAFDLADNNKLLLLDLKDLRAVLQYMGDNAAELSRTYGNIAKQSIGAILRTLLVLENDGADKFFGEPALDINDWLRCDKDGKGYINILECNELFQKPRLYATFLLWMLSELYESLPEVGDLEKPKAVFFFDEAHLLFNDAPKVLLTKIEQVVRLIRSKGVGIFFVTQNPTDIPDSVLAQLGNRIEHALRAYTPKELKKVKTVAETFRANPAFDTETAIMELGTGEALVSFIDDSGIPSMCERVFILPPQSKMGPLSESLVKQIVANGEYSTKYNNPIDRESAFEILNEQYRLAEEQAIEDARLLKEAKEKEAEEKRLAREEEKRIKKRNQFITSIGRTAVNTVTRDVTRNITRNVTKSFTRNIMGIFGK